jgi:hypothetical protein
MSSSDFSGDNESDSTNVSEALSSVTTAAVDFVVRDEPDVDAVEIARKQQLIEDRQLKTTYKVTLPLASETTKEKTSKTSVLNIGIALCQISKGRQIDSNTELILDTLDMVATPSVVNGDSNVERMDIGRIQRRIDGDFQGLVVSSVAQGSAGWVAGVRPGDILKTSSATLGNQLWPKSTLEGVKSALVSRKAVSESIQFEFQRLGETVDNQFELTLTKPIGLELKGKRRENQQETFS